MTIPAQRSFPYNGAVGGDSGPYDSDYFAQIMQAMLGAYTRRTTAGVLLGVGNGTQESLNVEETSPVSLGVLVREGWAMVNGRVYQATEDITVAIVQNNDPSGDDRIDSIVVRIDKSTPQGTLVAKQGTVAPAPVPPSLTQNSVVWEIRIANVTVQNGATTIVTGEIDNTARSYAIKWPVKNGGTDLTAVSAGQMLVGSGVDTYAALTAPSDWAQLRADASQTQKMRWVGDARTHAIRGTGGGGINVTPTLIPFAQADWLNPGGMITSLSSNQFTLAAGTYKVSGFITATSDTVVTLGFWIAVSSAPNTVLVASEWKSSSGTVSFPAVWRFLEGEIVSTGVELFEVYGEKSAASVLNLGVASTTGMTPSYTPYARQINFERIK